jgi:hypothetical protein
MSWFKFKKPPPHPAIPKYEPPAPLPPFTPKPKDEGIVVEEVDTSQMSRTGVHRAWDKLTGRFKGDK